jgi:hypothetical protein
VTADQTPYQVRRRFQFDAEAFPLDAETNVASGPAKQPTLTATVVESALGRHAARVSKTLESTSARSRPAGSFWICGSP